MLKFIRPLLICFCFIAIWIVHPYFNIPNTLISKTDKVKSTQNQSPSFQALDKIEWEEDFNHELYQHVEGIFPEKDYFFFTPILNFKVNFLHFFRIRSFFPPLYLQHCVYRI